MVGYITGLIAWWMHYVQDCILIQDSIQVCTFDIQLVKHQSKLVSHGNYGSGGCHFGHRCVGVIVVNSPYLTETLGHYSSRQFLTSRV